MSAGRSDLVGVPRNIRPVDTDPVIAEQIAYYRARAGEYDDWWERRAEYDVGPEFGAAWKRDVAELRAWLERVAPSGDVLELAAGTGNWTAELARYADRITAVDSSPEVLEINRGKNGTERVEYVVADLFHWSPPRRYDVVFFSFWISHVPSDRWDEFWRLVEASLAPGGLVLFCDNAHPDHARRHGPVDWRVVAAIHQLDDVDGEFRWRRLRSGSTFRIVKRYWRPDDLVANLGERGWRAQAGHTTFAFLYGEATRRR